MPRPRTLNATFSETNFDKLKEIKGDRSWETAILDEFGVDGDQE